MLTSNQELVVIAYEKGYRIINGECFNPMGKRINGCIRLHPVPYRQLSIKTPTGARAITYHSLLAYQLYGHAYFAPGIVARHLDGNSMNNSETNIVLGTMKDNIDDIPSKRRTDKNKQSYITSKKLKNGLKKLIIDDYHEGLTGPDIAKKHNICVNTVYLVIRSYKKHKLETE